MLFSTDRLESFFVLFLDIAKLISIKSVYIWVFPKMKTAASQSQRLMLFLYSHCFLLFFSHYIWQELMIPFLKRKYWRAAPPSLFLSSPVIYDTCTISSDIIRRKKASRKSEVESTTKFQCWRQYGDRLCQFSCWQKQRKERGFRFVGISFGNNL